MSYVSYMSYANNIQFAYCNGVNEVVYELFESLC